ncbi:hypothetical protein FKM82_023709 [Ascaphus truei]
MPPHTAGNTLITILTTSISHYAHVSRTHHGARQPRKALGTPERGGPTPHGPHICSVTTTGAGTGNNTPTFNTHIPPLPPPPTHSIGLK